MLFLIKKCPLRGWGGVCVTNLDLQKDCKIRTTVQYKEIFLDRCFDMTQILCSHKSASPLISECVQPEIFTFVHEKVPSRKIACQPGWQADTYSVPLVLDLSQFTRLCQSKFFWKILSVKKLTFCNSVIMSNTGSLDLFEWWGNSRVVSECRNTKQQMSRAAQKKIQRGEK